MYVCIFFANLIIVYGDLRVIVIVILESMTKLFFLFRIELNFHKIARFDLDKTVSRARI